MQKLNILSTILFVALVSTVNAQWGYFSGSVQTNAIYLRKKIKDLTVTAGYMYDQIGTGIIYRTYEERALGIDNALLGARLEYNVKDMLKLKAFAGVQKLKFSIQKPLIVGFNAEGNFNIKNKAMLLPGIGVVNRSMDQQNIEQVVATIESYDTIGRFVPKYNTYAFTVYNTLTVGDFTWYAEGAYKTSEAIKKRSDTRCQIRLSTQPVIAFIPR